MNAPETSFYVTGGTLRSDAPSYVERQADKELLQGLLRGEFCYVLTSRQMGKSSLMVRTASKLREQGIAAVVLDLTAFGQTVTPEQWYDGLLSRMGRQLNLESELEKYTETHQKIGPCQRFFDAIRDVVLPKVTTDPSANAQRDDRNWLVIFVDEIDTVRSLPFTTDEFFAGIRECYNRRAEEPDFSRLTFCLLGVARPSDLIRDNRVTPFNIGRRIELNDFTTEEAAVLARGLEEAPPAGGKPGSLASRHANQLLDRALFWTNGHPYLTQRLCGAVLERRSGATPQPQSSAFHTPQTATQMIDEICFDLFFSSGARDRDDNLIFVREHLLRSETDRASLFHSYDRVLRGKHVPDDETNPITGALRLTGIVRVAAGGLVERNRIYARSFDRKWVRANMPDAEIRRQRAAFRRGVLRTTAIAAAIIAAMVVMVVRERKALGQSYLSQARAERVSGLAGQRYRSVEALRQACRYNVDSAVVREELIASLALADLKESSKAKAQRSANGFDIPEAREAATVDLSPDGRKLAVGQKDGLIEIRAFPSREILHRWKLRWDSGLPREPQVLRLNPSGDLLAESCLADVNVQIWDVKTRAITLRLYHPDKVFDIAWHRRGELLATACADGSIYLWDTNHAERPLKKLIGHENGVRAVAFNHRGTLLASAGFDETLRLWTPATERQVTHRLQGEILERLQFSNEDDLLVATTSRQNEQGNAERAWEVAGEEYVALQVRAGVSDKLNSIDFSPDGRWLVASASERAIVWDTSSGSEAAALDVVHAHTVGFAAESKYLLASTDAGFFEYPLNLAMNQSATPDLDSTPEVERAARLRQAPDELGPMTLSGDRRTAVTVHQDEIVVLSLGAGTNATAHATGVGNHYRWLALHPQKLWLAAMLPDSESIHLWNYSELLATNSQTNSQAKLLGSEYFVFSPDGKWFVTCSSDQFQFYQVGSWDKALFPIPRTPASIQHAPIAFSYDGKLVALASSRYVIHVMKLVEEDGRITPKLIGALESPDRSPLEMLVFSPDGTRLAAGTMNLTIQLWNLTALRKGLAELKLASDWPTYR